MGKPFCMRCCRGSSGRSLADLGILVAIVGGGLVVRGRTEGAVLVDVEQARLLLLITAVELLADLRRMADEGDHLAARVFEHRNQRQHFAAHRRRHRQTMLGRAVDADRRAGLLVPADRPDTVPAQLVRCQCRVVGEGGDIGRALSTGVRKGRLDLHAGGCRVVQRHHFETSGLDGGRASLAILDDHRGIGDRVHLGSWLLRSKLSVGREDRRQREAGKNENRLLHDVLLHDG